MSKAVVAVALLCCSAPLGAVDGADGKWQATPLALIGAAAEGGGTFQQFGDMYATTRFVLFWARVGPTGKDWALFSSKNGKLVRAAREGVPVPTPDGRTIKLRQKPDEYTAVMRAGRDLVYISALFPDHVYAWDGERLVKVLAAGDILTVNGVACRIKKAVVLDVDDVGRALVYYDSSQPEAEGWAIYDGSKFTALWKEGDALPGNPGVTIKNLSSGAFCRSNCVPDARLLADGSLLATVEVLGAPHKMGLYHFTASGARLLLADGQAAPDPTAPSVVRLGQILAARTDAFVMDDSETQRKTLHLGGTIYSSIESSPRLLFCNAGRIRIFEFPGEFELTQVVGSRRSLPSGTTFDYDGAMFLDTTSPRALISVRAGSVSVTGAWIARQTTESYPGIYFFDGEKLERIRWEADLGLAPEAVKTKLTSAPKLSGLNSTPAERILLSRLDQPAGVRVQLPSLDSARVARLVAAGSSDGKLMQGTAFETGGEAVTEADVLVWNSADEATVSTSRGIFSLRRLAR
jgi:hypothetical protein